MSGTVAGSSAGGGASALGGLGGSLEDKDCELLCPVCFELIEEAYVTRCGHSFCFACISKAVELHHRCPKCGATLATREHIFPNFLLNEVVAKRRARGPSHAGNSGGVGSAEALHALVAASSRRLELADVESLLELLTRRKRLLQAESAAHHHRLVYEFLAQLLASRQQQLEVVSREARLVKQDMETVAGVLRELQAGPAGGTPSPRAGGDSPHTSTTLYSVTSLTAQRSCTSRPRARRPP